MPTHQAKDQATHQQADRTPDRRFRDLTPFGEVLAEYQWKDATPLRPPLSSGALALRLKNAGHFVNRITVSSWITRRIVPPPERIYEVLRILDIPISRLVQAYHDHGEQPPDILAELAAPPPSAAPAPRTFQTQTGRTSTFIQEQQRQWTSFLDHAASTLRDQGLTEDTIQAFIAHMSAHASGEPDNPFARYRIAEHTPATETTAPAQAKSVRAAAGEHHERRQPRKRVSSAPRRKPDKPERTGHSDQ